MKFNPVSNKLEIPLGGRRRLFIYVQAYNNVQVQINVYYYDRFPYSDSVESKSLVFAFTVTLRL